VSEVGEQVLHHVLLLYLDAAALGRRCQALVPTGWPDAPGQHPAGTRPERAVASAAACAVASKRHGLAPSSPITTFPMASPPVPKSPW
jgi:hypothetical protein